MCHIRRYMIVLGIFPNGAFPLCRSRAFQVSHILYISYIAYIPYIVHISHIVYILYNVYVYHISYMYAHRICTHPSTPEPPEPSKAPEPSRSIPYLPESFWLVASQQDSSRQQGRVGSRAKALKERSPPRQKSRVERIKANVEPPLTFVTVENVRAIRTFC